jgi:uncharacterized protein YcfJ
MRKLLTLMAMSLTLGASVAATTPALASNACERDKHDAKVGGTLLGALGGAVVGSAVAGRGNKTGGVLLGAAGGAVVGNQLARSKRPCPSGYHANPRHLRHETYRNDRDGRYDRDDHDRR